MKRIEKFFLMPIFLRKNRLLSMFFSFLLVFSVVSCNNTPSNENTEGVDYNETGTLGEDIEQEDVLETEDDFASYDVNTDDMWDDSEFETVADESGWFDDWDSDGDGLFNDDEVGKGIFDNYDTDGDGIFNEDEFSTWNSAWGGEYDDEWTEWDINDDNSLDYNEYNTGFNTLGAYNGWDIDNDGLYSQDELNDGLFTTWDADDDGFLNDAEYEAIGYDNWRN